MCREKFNAHCTNLACVVGWYHAESTGSLGNEHDDDPFERLLAKNYELGIVSALERLPERISRLAGASICRQR